MGHITNFPALKDLVTPTRVRIAMVQVSNGSTYDPSILAGSDAGSQPNPDAAAGPDGGATTDGAAGLGTNPETDGGAATSADAADAGVEGDTSSVPDGAGTVATMPTTAPTPDAAGAALASQTTQTQTSGCAIVRSGLFNRGPLAFLLALGLVWVRRARARPPRPDTSSL